MTVFSVIDHYWYIHVKLGWHWTILVKNTEISPGKKNLSEMLNQEDLFYDIELI